MWRTQNSAAVCPGSKNHRAKGVLSFRDFKKALAEHSKVDCFQIHHESNRTLKRKMRISCKAYLGKPPRVVKSIATMAAPSDAPISAAQVLSPLKGHLVLGFHSCLLSLEKARGRLLYFISSLTIPSSSQPPAAALDSSQGISPR